jgi:hypothetical protein
MGLLQRPGSAAINPQLKTLWSEGLGAMSFFAKLTWIIMKYIQAIEITL